MEVAVTDSYCVCWTLRAGCLVIGWFDIVYGNSMVFVYLLSMYTGYFEVEGTYKAALWLDFVFTIAQLVGGIVLVYGVKFKTIWLVLLSSLVGFTLMAEDVVGDILLYLSFPDETYYMYLLLGCFLVCFIGLRAYMTLSVYRFYKQLKEEVVLRNKMWFCHL